MIVMDEKIDLSDTHRHAGKHTKPNIKNQELPIGGGMLFGMDMTVLDSAMGYGCDIAFVKKSFPNIEAHGIDIGLVMTDEVWEEGNMFSYGKAREVVKQAFSEDLLPLCNVDWGEVTDLSRFWDEYFDRILSLGLIHQLERGKRRESFAQALSALKNGGVFAAYSLSGVGMQQIVLLKGSYDWVVVRKTLDDGTPNPQIDQARRESFICDIRRLLPSYDSMKPDDKLKVEKAAGNLDEFKLIGLLPEMVESDLRDAGYKDVAVFHTYKYGGSIGRISFFARK
jgi:hypothetical protein